MFALRTLCQNQKYLWRSWRPVIQTRFGSDEVNYNEDLLPDSQNITLENESYLYLNEINLIGTVVNNPKLIETSQTVKPCVYFRLCTKHLHMGHIRFGKNYLSETYHTIVVYRSQLKNYTLKNVRAGNRLFVNGEMRNRKLGMFVVSKKIISLELLKN